MKVLIDTNVIMDVLTNREPHVEFSASFLKMCGTQITGFIAASQTTDIFYLLRRLGKDAPSSKDIIKKLTDEINVLNITRSDVQKALASDMPDYEDALLAHCAKRQKIDYIITRNEINFTLSPISAIQPKDILAQFYSI